MKKVVFYDDIRETDFKPNKLLDAYLDITEKEVKEYFTKSEVLKGRDCPACHAVAEKNKKAFSKFGLDYYECAKCGSLYISPCPTDKAIDNYYRNSEASSYWKNILSRNTEDKRKEKIAEPRIQWIVDAVNEYLKNIDSYVDFNTNNPYFIDRILKDLERVREKIIVNPRFDGISNYNNRVKIIEDKSGNYDMDIKPDSVDVISLFEVIDRISDMDKLLHSINSMLKSGGLCFVTTLSISGFDLQVLRKESKSIFPPDRINVLSLEGIEILFKKYGFDCIELSTPGLLDVEIVASALRDNPSLDLPGFIKYFITKRGAETHEAFQEFLQMNRLSSYVRAIFRKL